MECHMVQLSMQEYVSLFRDCFNRASLPRITFPRDGSVGRCGRQNVYQTAAMTSISNQSGAAPDLCGRVCIVSAARTLVDSVRRSCYAGLSLAVTSALARLRAAKHE
eukprot:s1165_g12.t1